MAKFFTRLSQQKVECGIELQVLALEIESESTMQVALNWKRGPQTEQTKLLNVIGGSRQTLDVQDTFYKSSGFYKDAKGEWDKKDCQVQLGVMADGQWRPLGRVDIDMGPLVGHKDKELRFQFPKTAEFSYAEVLLMFTIAEGSASCALAPPEEEQKQAPVEEVIQAPVESVQQPALEDVQRAALDRARDRASPPRGGRGRPV